MKRFALWGWLLYIAIWPITAFPSLFGEWLFLLVILLLPISWIVRKAVSGHFFPPTPLDWTLVLFSLMLLVSLWATPEINYSLPWVIRVVYGISFLYVVVNYIGSRRERLLPATMFYLALGIIIALAGLLLTEWVKKYPVMEPVVAFMPLNSWSVPEVGEGMNTNQTSGVLLLMTPIAVALTTAALAKRVKQGKETDRQTIWLLLVGAAASLLFVGYLILAQARSAYLGLGVALLFMILTALLPRMLAPLIISGAVFVGAAITWQFVAKQSLIPFLLGNVPEELLGAGFVESIELRREIWARAIYGIQDFPLTGMGLHTYRLVVPILYPLFTLQGSGPEHAHNQFLQAGLDLGIPGLIAYLALWLGLAGLLWHAWRSSGDFWLRTLALGCAGSLLAHSIYASFNALFLGARLGFVLWLLFGLITGLYAVFVSHPAEISKNDLGFA